MESEIIENNKVRLSVRHSKIEDCEVVFNKLREADRDEVQAVYGESTAEALVFSWSQTEEPFTIVSNGETPEALFGVVPVEEKVGCIWLLGSDAIEKGRVRFLRESRRWLKHVSRDYHLLFNYVDERNTVHIRWIEWLGFTFINRHEHYGVESRPFLEFVRIF